MAFPQVVQSTTVSNSNLDASTFDVTLPPSLVDGNLLLMHVSSDSSFGSVPVIISGWQTVLEDRDFATNQSMQAKIVASGDSDSVVTINTDDYVENFIYVVMVEISGWSGDLNDIGVGQSTSGGSGTTKDVVGIFPDLSNAEDVLWLSSYSTTVYSSPGEDITITSPAGWTEVGNYSDINGSTALAHIESNGVQVPQGTWALSPAAVPFRQTFAILPGTGATSDPEATLDAPLQVGESFSGTYNNFTGVPTGPVTISDGTRSITAPVTIADDASGGGTFSGTMPSFPAAGASDSAGSHIYPNLTADSISITLTDPGA